MSDRSLTLVGADGVQYQLVCPSKQDALALGLDSTVWGGTSTHAFQTRDRVGVAGQIVEGVRWQAATFKLPILNAWPLGSEQAVSDTMDTLWKALGPGRTVRLIHTRPDGTRRSMTCSYVSGGELMTITSHDDRWIISNLVMRAHTPFWVGGMILETITWGGTTAHHTIVNDGDVPTWPRWTITAPSENTEITSLTTGQTFRLARSAAAYQHVIVDTNPRTWSSTIGGTPNDSIWDPLSRDFFPLQPGPNHLLLRHHGGSSISVHAPVLHVAP